MNLRWFLLNFSDRLPRKWWWIASTCLYAIYFIVIYVSARTAGNEVLTSGTASHLFILSSVAFSILTLGLNVKRFNDLNFPIWVGFALLVANLSLELPWLIAGDAQPGSFVSALAFWFVAGLWCIIIPGYAWLGFHRGSVGKNQHGEDPLKGVSEVENLPEVSGAQTGFEFKNLVFLPFGRLGRPLYIGATITTLTCIALLYYSFFAFLLAAVPTIVISEALMLLYFSLYSFFWAVACLAAKRMHDVNRSGVWPVLIAWQALLCVGELTQIKFDLAAGSLHGYLVAGYLLFIVVWLFHELLLRPGTPGDNAFGPDPRQTRQKGTD